ncbi:putative superfamily III holin-X [Albidovulum inexpectatum]|uniref:Putative superfamily III holin-X n=1 Tax=Albidovulum inexpectatum TaxID=196587 RepID=A0A2S5JIC4_9RHOB|nr:phage holin family protein [Albidovulum inexpectatum]PPB81180.1 putative superfamily III holin-X [Albidovulum inexpectatum]
MNHDPREAPSFGMLAARVIDHVTGLVRKEIRLARAEAAEKLRVARRGIVNLVAAAIMALVGLIVLSDAAVAALVIEGGIAPHWAALIVAGAILIIAIVLGLNARAALSPDTLKPQRTLRQLGLGDKTKETRHG